MLPAAISTHAPAGGATKLPAAGSTSALNFYSRPCGRGDGAPLQASRPAGQFLLTPLREGRPDAALQTDREDWISTHAPAGGATDGKFHIPLTQQEFLLTPLREGRPRAGGRNDGNEDHFYSRPCGRGDDPGANREIRTDAISTHAPAGGATRGTQKPYRRCPFLLTPLREGRPDEKETVIELNPEFLLTPLREGRRVERYQVRFRCGFLLTPLREGRPPIVLALSRIGNDFYSRPCGRGDVTDAPYTYTETEFLLTPLREGRRGAHRYRRRAKKHFYSRPCGRGDPSAGSPYTTPGQFLLTPLRAGRRSMINTQHVLSVFLLTPLREGRRPWGRRGSTQNGFLLTPLREGRHSGAKRHDGGIRISTHAPAGGATSSECLRKTRRINFYSRPCGRGDGGTTLPSISYSSISTHAPAGGATLAGTSYQIESSDFYSRPCGRGDVEKLFWRCVEEISTHAPAGGATLAKRRHPPGRPISTHAPAGGATETSKAKTLINPFLLTPLREGRLSPHRRGGVRRRRFLLTPLREGRRDPGKLPGRLRHISTHAPAGGATRRGDDPVSNGRISTHAPAGGATAIFHKSVMRFCGKLPKDDTVLCLASFGFPRRDPKAVYLAWISCANLPQKCVREGLALKDQGTSCFHEGLASHAFDPVLV